MKMSSDLIKENHRYLKACILYEALQKIPIFDSYRSFCDTVGHDAMGYPDFEFWYYRFYHGNRDLDYDWSVDPKPKTIMDIPAISMAKIAEYLDPVERTRIRSMNRAIKAVADSIPPVFEKIEIIVSDSSMSWWLNDKRFSCDKKGSGCTLYRPYCSKVEKRDTCHIKKGLEHLAPVLKMPNIQVNHFSLRLYDKTLNRDDFLPATFNAKSVHIYGQTTNQVAQFLSAMTPGHLESISLDVSMFGRENKRIIFDTDQFKLAKSVEFKFLWTINVKDLVHFSHLNRFKCRLISDNAVEDVPRIRDMISTFEEFESCELEFSIVGGRCRMRKFAEALGEEIPIGAQPMKITHWSVDPEAKTLVDMPVVLMNKVAKYLDPVERTYLRSMNHAIKAVADTFPPVFEKIEVSVSDSSLYWKLNNQSFSCSNNGNGCSLKKPNSSKVEKSEEFYIKKGLEYLAPVLKMPNIQVNFLSLYLPDEILNPDDLLPASFNAQSVYIYSKNTNEVVQFLSKLTPGYLESISLKLMCEMGRENYGIIFETDQFKQAKSFEYKSFWVSFTVNDLLNFSHLKSFKCRLRSENAFQDVPRIRDMISTFDEFESCELEFRGRWDSVPMREFVEALGEKIPIGPLKEGEKLTITHYYRIPESRESLVFKITDDETRCHVGIRKIR
ncbi:hypothetical protein B9Z55_027043 [Caenorhabditis nigoni]|uniref:F-box domain-containing protein n=2 Tax=Caenorhabditis nigoni TaxID=1611254 RepID=A0A2G5SJ41_9PELO|nr:hypothetical protein B9Z55_027043 [Caenorhabditis nigoni]